MKSTENQYRIVQIRDEKKADSRVQKIVGHLF